MCSLDFSRLWNFFQPAAVEPGLRPTPETLPKPKCDRPREVYGPERPGFNQPGDAWNALGTPLPEDRKAMGSNVNFFEYKSNETFRPPQSKVDSTLPKPKCSDPEAVYGGLKGASTHADVWNQVDVPAYETSKATEEQDAGSRREGEVGPVTESPEVTGIPETKASST